MANYVEPQVVINYISQRKKIIVNRNNQPSQLLIQTDYNLNETYNFQIVNAINQIVQFDADTYEVYGSYIDAKNQTHILFYTPNFVIRDNILSFVINTYTSQYMAYVKRSQTPIDFSIVAKKGSRTFLLLRDKALANPRAYIEGQTPTEIVYQNIFNADVPVTGAFGAGNNINLAQDYEGEDIASFAFGDTLSATNENQFVIGYNNTPDATKAFIIANSGNIFTVDYEGNVEAGDLNVGAISATSITVSGEDLNQVIDDKVEYLSTSVDEKLSATEDWVSDTFETKEAATQTFNELEGDIDQISSFVSGLPEDIAAKADQTDVDAISAFVSGLPQDISDLSGEVYQNFELKEDATSKFNTLTGQTDYLSSAIDAHTQSIGELNNAVAAKANQTDLEALSGQVEAITVPTKVSDLEQDIPYLSSITSADIPTSYVQQSDLEDYAKTDELSAYATSAWVDQNYAKKGEAPTDVYTKAEVNEISSALSSAVSEAGYLTEIPTSYVQEDEISDMATQTWVGEQGFLTEVPNTYATKTDVENATSAMATTGWVSEQGYLTEVPNTYALKTDIPTNAEIYEAISGDVEAQITGKNYITSDALNGLANEADLQYVSGVVSAQAEDITALKAVSGEVDYETVFDMLSSGDTDTLTITKDDQNEKIVFTAAGGGGGGDKTYHGDGGIEVNNVTDTISISANFLSANALEGYATQSWVGEQGYLTEVPNTYALKTDIPTDVATSAYVQSASGNAVDVATGWVDGKNYLTEIPNTYALKTDVDTASGAAVTAATGWVDGQGYLKSVPADTATTGWVDENYAKKGEAPTDVYTKAEVDAISTALSTTVSEAGYLTSVPDTVSAAAVNAATGWVNGQGYAQTSDIPTNAEITGLAKDYVDTLNIGTTYATKDELSAKTTSAQVSSIVESYGFVTENTTYSDGNLIAITGTTNTINFTGTIPSNSDISGIASAVASTYVENSSISAVGQLNNDVGYITGYQAGDGIAINNGIISATGGGGGGSSYTAGTGINIASDVISVKPSEINTSDLNNNAGFITSYVNTTYAAGEGLALSGTGLSTFVLTAQIPDDAHISAIASGYAGGGSDSGPTNKQIVSSGFIYDSSIQIYKNAYTPTNGVVTLGEFTIPVGSLGANEVATFEEWVTASNKVTGFVFEDVILIGELPSTFTENYYYVFTRRINSNGDQFISFAYECTTDKYATMPLTFKSIGNTTVTMSQSGTITESLSTSTDGGTTWSAYSPGNSINLTDGQTVMFSGTNSFTPNYNAFRYFTTSGTGTLKVMGNIMSLNGFDSTQMRNYEFYWLFKGCTNIVDASKLKLPATTLAQSSYRGMFWNCSNLTTPPQLPATTLAQNCYYMMFYNCTALTSAPYLPATTLVNSCYAAMFENCTSLTTAPVLPAIELDEYCYSEMFYGCTSLTNIEVAFTDWKTSNYATTNWVTNVGANGTFTKPNGLAASTGDNFIPAGWTVINK